MVIPEQMEHAVGEQIDGLPLCGVAELFGLLLDLWECHRQYTGSAQPKRERFIDDIIPDGI